ncbi:MULTISPECIES: YARHG domain-containing protein [Fusobacterium]|nr:MULTISPECIES: YARHG domain-containing protein [Fusobacterium]EUB30068.1 PF14415 domain protein [Fusobacterium sp. OBRC1]MCG6839115.1 YARHG domain-containing protein [Fusobacterium nucleatum]QJX51425.1 YARHG domain-containing protein [Fusobacterium nucleatum]WRL72323.1 YARHG domain-containing protein [Fusobacterium polymorphum]
MKKILLAILFCLLSIFTFANDWEFGSEGEHIIPLKGSNMSIKKEKITLKLTPDGMLVNVKFTFDNPTAENKIVGFVTPESGNGEEEDETTKPKRKAEPLKIKNFKTTVNGKEVKSNVELLSKLLSKGVLDNNIIKEYTEKEKTFYNYVYYFNADFKQGENVVEHSYFYTGSYGIYERDFEYVVTTISKWKNQTVEDFEIEVHPENYFVKLPYSFWKDNKKINWEVVGKGKMVTIAPTKKSNDEDATGLERYGIIYLKLNNGFVRYKTKNFSPNQDFYMTRMDNILGFDYEFPEGKIQGYKFKDDYFTTLRETIYDDYPNIVSSLKDLKDKDLDIIRNYPYAFAGYDFAKKDLKDYFSQFIWYTPVGKNVKIDPNFNNIIKAVDEIKAKRKK